MKPARAAIRWDLWLPGAGLLVAGMLVVLAATTARAQRDRHTVALEGRLLRLAHRLEERLRDEGPAAADAALAEELDANAALVEGLALLGPGGDVETEVGSGAAARALEVELFLGRSWRFGSRGRLPPGPPGRHGGRRILRLQPTAQALARPLSDLLLLPVVLAAALILVALSVLGGVLLIRQQQEVERRAARQRLEGLARAGAGLAHQLRNPLATIKGSCQLLLESAAAGNVKRLEAVLAQTERMERLVGHLLDYARPPQPEPQAVALRSVLEELTELDPRVAVEIADDLAARVDPEHLQQILANLVENALQAGPPTNAVEVRAAATARAVELTIADRGPGPEGEPEHLFEPYVTSRADGTGLGLPIARALAQANGGELELRPRPGGGMLALLTLPAAETRGA